MAWYSLCFLVPYLLLAFCIGYALSSITQWYSEEDNEARRPGAQRAARRDEEYRDGRERRWFNLERQHAARQHPQQRKPKQAGKQRKMKKGNQQQQR